jgi:nitrate reductase NapE component
MFVFGFLVWLYVVVIQITHPEWLSGQFSHVTVPLLDWRLDEVGIIAFAVSAFGFFVWQLEEENDSKR